VDWPSTCLAGTLPSGTCTGTCKTGFIKKKSGVPTNEQLSSTCNINAYTTPDVTCAAGAVGWNNTHDLCHVTFHSKI
jgi:hypothetical protein